MNPSSFGMNGAASNGGTNGASSFGASSFGASSSAPRSGGRGPQAKIFGIPADTDRDALKSHFAAAGKIYFGAKLSNL